MKTLQEKIDSFYDSIGVNVPEDIEVMTAQKLPHESEEQYRLFEVFLHSSHYFIQNEGPYVIVNQEITFDALRTYYHNNNWLHRKICEAATRYELSELKGSLLPSEKLENLIEYAKSAADSSLALSAMIYSKCMVALDSIEPTKMGISDIAQLLRVGVQLGEYGIEMAATINGFSDILASLEEEDALDG